MLQELVNASLAKIREWDLTKRERALAALIINLSFSRGRKHVFIPKLDCFVALTGIDRSDVSDALSALKLKGVLHVSGPSQGGKRYTFLPSAELLEPERIVDPRAAEEAMLLIEAANAGTDEPFGQMRLPHTVTAEERLSADLADGSMERVLSSPEVDVDVLNQQIAESLGVPVPVTVGNSPTPPWANRPRPTVGDSPTVGTASHAYARTSKTSNVPSGLTSTTGATALQFTGRTGDCGAVAPKDLMERLEAVVGSEQWSSGRRWGALWSKALTQTPVAVRAAFEALGEYELSVRSKGKPNSPGGYVWGIFTRIQRQLMKRSPSTR